MEKKPETQEEDHQEGGESSSSSTMKRKQRPADGQSSSSMENKKLEDDQVRPQYPKGVRFLPTDVELVRDYLMKKFHGEDVPVPVPMNQIQEAQVYQFSPMQLAERYKITNEKGIYLFTYWKHEEGGLGERRVPGHGKWKASKPKGADIKEGDKRLGVKTNFNKFVSLKEDNALNQNWRVKEYALPDPKNKAKAKLLDGFVLCYVYEKKKRAVEEVEDIIVNKEELEPPSEPTMISTRTEEYFKSFPSGVLFSPTDKELVYYLWVKNNFDGDHLPTNRIHEVDEQEFYNFHPKHLTGMHELIREDRWYFFVRKNKKEIGSQRAAVGGYWKLKQDSSSTVKCHKIHFKFHEKQKQQPDGDRKVWRMYEYSIHNPGKQKLKQYWDLCKIWSFNKRQTPAGKESTNEEAPEESDKDAATNDDQKGEGSKNREVNDLNEEPPEESDEDACTNDQKGKDSKNRELNDLNEEPPEESDEDACTNDQKGKERKKRELNDLNEEPPEESDEDA